MERRFRKHIRLEGFDYSSANYYFVTICTKDREKLFEPRVSKRYGHELPDSVAAASYAAKSTAVLARCIDDLSENYYDNLVIDFYCVMPDHLHIIFAFCDTVTKKGAIGSRSYNLGDIVRALKATMPRDCGRSLWQPNYYEHVIRSESSLQKIREYILRNPYVGYDEIDWQRLDPKAV